MIDAADSSIVVRMEKAELDRLVYGTTYQVVSWNGDKPQFILPPPLIVTGVDLAERSVTFTCPISPDDLMGIELVSPPGLGLEYLLPDPLPGFAADDGEWVTCEHSRLVEGFSSYYCQDCPAKLKRNLAGELEVVW